MVRVSFSSQLGQSQNGSAMGQFRVSSGLVQMVGGLGLGRLGVRCVGLWLGVLGVVWVG